MQVKSNVSIGSVAEGTKKIKEMNVYSDNPIKSRRDVTQRGPRSSLTAHTHLTSSQYLHPSEGRVNISPHFPACRRPARPGGRAGGLIEAQKLSGRTNNVFASLLHVGPETPSAAPFVLNGPSALPPATQRALGWSVRLHLSASARRYRETQRGYRGTCSIFGRQRV